MMRLRDWVSFFVGLVLFLLGLVPLLEQFNIVAWGFSDFLSQVWFAAILPYIVAIAGFYLLIEAIEEIINSSSMGWISFIVGGILMLLGSAPILAGYGILPATFAFQGLLSGTIGLVIYRMIFIVEGIFLMIATFAMEL